MSAGCLRALYWRNIMSEVDRYKPYKGAAAGWGALIAVTKNWLGSENAFKNIRAMLKTNQNGGFDCPGCAWGDSPESGRWTRLRRCSRGRRLAGQMPSRTSVRGMLWGWLAASAGARFAGAGAAPG